MAKPYWYVPGGTRHKTLTTAKKAAAKSSSASAMMSRSGGFTLKKKDDQGRVLEERDCRLTRTKTGKITTVCYVPGKGFRGLSGARRRKTKRRR